MSGGNWKKVVTDLGEKEPTLFLDESDDGLSFMNKHLVNVDSQKFKSKYITLEAYALEVIKQRHVLQNTVFGLGKNGISGFGKEVAANLAASGPNGPDLSKLFYSNNQHEFVTITNNNGTYTSNYGYDRIYYNMRPSSNIDIDYINVAGEKAQAPLWSARHLVTNDVVSNSVLLSNAIPFGKVTKPKTELVEKANKKLQLITRGNYEEASKIKLPKFDLRNRIPFTVDEKDDEKDNEKNNNKDNYNKLLSKVHLNTRLNATVVDKNTLPGAFEAFMNMIMYGPYNAGSAPTNKAILQCWPAIALNPKVVQQVLNPVDVKDYLTGLYRLSLNFDKVSDLDKEGSRWWPRTEKLSTTWGNIVKNYAKSATSWKPEEKKKYDELSAMLYQTTTNPITGITSTTKTALYSGYTTAQTAYINAQVEYVDKYFQYEKDPDKWAKYGPIYKQKEQVAYDNWVANGKTEVEAILAQMDVLLRAGTASAISAASKLYTDQAIKIQDNGVDITYYPAYIDNPSIFDDGFDGWSEINISSGQDYSKLDYMRQEAKAKSSFFYNIFSFGGSGGWSKETKNEVKESTSVSIKGKFARTGLSFGWLVNSWMKAEDWYMANQKKGQVSKGNIGDNINDTKLWLPVTPSEIIVVSDVEITANWSESTSKEMTEKINAGASIGIGPFNLSGSYDSDEHHVEKFASFENGVLKIKKPQIVAFIVDVPPYGAPMDS